MGKIDQIVLKAVALVNSLSPEERAAARLELLSLVRAVECAHLGEHEEVWCLREQDAAAPSTIEAWSIFANRMHVDPEKSDAARRTAARWREWQQADLLRVKVPD